MQKKENFQSSLERNDDSIIALIEMHLLGSS
jgi:hypothetical protein